MATTRILESSDQLVTQFQRCCRSYRTLDIAVAWCGDPKKTLPFQLLAPIGSRITAIVGISFHQTHPNAIEWFMDLGADIRVFKQKGPTFHPKIYCFRKRNQYALFVGSSNLTYSGFYANYETNCLIEGSVTERTPNHITPIHSLMEKWRTDDYSFSPTKQWLRGYRNRHRRAIEKQRELSVSTHSLSDEDIPEAAWLQTAGWDIYYEKVVEGLNRLGSGEKHQKLLDLVAQHLEPPWTRRHFNNEENRRLIGGYKPYGWFGHLGASGDFKRMLKNGTVHEQRTIARTINAITNLKAPVPYDQLAQHLNALLLLGPTMKVWSRLLCIVRPGIYCTVASPSVRKNLSAALGVSKNRFERVDGYVDLLRRIHASPWYSAAEPTDDAQRSIWRRRVAFLDAIFYEEQ